MRTPTRAGCRFRAAATPRRNAALPAWPQALHVRDRATRHPQAAWPDEDIVLWQHGRQTLHSGAVEQGSRQRIQVFQQHARLDGAQPRVPARHAPMGNAQPARRRASHQHRRRQAHPARRGIGKVQFNISTASLLVVRAHARQRRPTIGTRAAVGVPPAAGARVGGQDGMPRRGGRETPRRAGPGRVAPARPGRDPARTRCAASRRSPARFRATDSDATQTKPPAQARPATLANRSRPACSRDRSHR